jgi:hypothetical protein
LATFRQTIKTAFPELRYKILNDLRTQLSTATEDQKPGLYERLRIVNRSLGIKQSKPKYAPQTNLNTGRSHIYRDVGRVGQVVPAVVESISHPDFKKGIAGVLAEVDAAEPRKASAVEEEVSRPQFTLVISALPSRVPVDQRLRAFLKRALRDWNLRCESITPSEPTETTTEAQPGTGIEQLRKLKEELQ